MRLSKNFVNEYTNLNKIDFKELADGMLKLGNEYESISKLVNATKVITGEVIECVDHPESDHLHLCKVDIGSEVLNIVCGAPNVRVGLKVIVALEGCELGDFKICETPKETALLCLAVVIAIIVYPFKLTYSGYKWCVDKLKPAQIAQ